MIEESTGGINEKRIGKVKIMKRRRSKRNRRIGEVKIRNWTNEIAIDEMKWKEKENEVEFEMKFHRMKQKEVL